MENMTIIKLGIAMLCVRIEPFTFFVPFFPCCYFFKCNKSFIWATKTFYDGLLIFFVQLLRTHRMLLLCQSSVSVVFHLISHASHMHTRMAIDVYATYAHDFRSLLFWGGCSLVDVCERKTRELLRLAREIENSFETQHTRSSNNTF